MSIVNIGDIVKYVPTTNSKIKNFHTNKTVNIDSIKKKLFVLYTHEKHSVVSLLQPLSHNTRPPKHSCRIMLNNLPFTAKYNDLYLIDNSSLKVINNSISFDIEKNIKIIIDSHDKYWNNKDEKRKIDKQNKRINKAQIRKQNNIDSPFVKKKTFKSHQPMLSGKTIQQYDSLNVKPFYGGQFQPK